MFWQASAACASCGASVLVRPWPGLTATRLACTAGWGLGRGTGGGLGERAQAALALPQRAYRRWPTATGRTTQIWPAGVRCDTHHAKPAHAL